MLKELKFVQGAVAKKDFLPAMTHFAIEKGTVRSYNGVLALSSPIALDIECKPKADKFVQAIANCTETVALSMTTTGRLSIKSGKFKAFVDCVTEDTPHVWPEGERMDFDGAAVLQAFKVLHPFIGDDASRPWSNGVLLRGQSAYATNNVTLVEYWLGADVPVVVNIPRVCIREMLRIDEAPTHAQLTPNSITFHYSDGRWVRSQLFETKWPDLSKILDAQCNALPVDPLLFEGLDVVKPFLDNFGRVFLRDGKISTVTKEGEGDQHGEFEIPGLTAVGIFSHAMLKLLEGTATTADLSTYPQPCLFYGERLRGAIVGLRM